MHIARSTLFVLSLLATATAQLTSSVETTTSSGPVVDGDLCNPERDACSSFASPVLRDGRDHVSVITGYVFFDHNEDGVWNPGVDPDELPIAGWRVEILLDGVLDGVTYTDAAGLYSFTRPLDHTTWTIREQAPGGFIGDGIPGAFWLAMTPRSGDVVTCTCEVAGPDFGNLSFEVKPGVGRTKGFWHNRNGKAILAAADPAWRDALTVRDGITLNLRHPVLSSDPNVSIFKPLPLPATFNQAHANFADWIVSNSTSGHAGFILSTQLAASILNADFGFMQFTTYVDVHQNGLLESFEELVEHAAGLLTDPNAGLTGPQGPALHERDHIMYCINEFTGINSTGDVTAPQIVFGKTRTPAPILGQDEERPPSPPVRYEAETL